MENDDYSLQNAEDQEHPANDSSETFGRDKLEDDIQVVDNLVPAPNLNGSKYERIRKDHRVAKVETTGVAATEKDLQDQVAPFQTSIWFCEPQTSI